MDKVSVVVPSYNGGRFLDDLIDNVFRQTLEVFELIIVIDASQDNSIEIVTMRQKLDSRIILIVNSVNVGASKCRNLAIERCSGDFIAFMDHDDLWHPRKLERQVESLKRDPSLAGVLCSYIICKDRESAFKALGAFKYHDTLRMFKNWLNFNGDGPLLPSTLMIRNSGTIIKFNERLRALYDLDYFHELSKIGRIENVVDFLVFYVQHNHQMHRNPLSVLEIGNLSFLSEKESERLTLIASIYSKLIGGNLTKILGSFRELNTRDFIVISLFLVGVFKRRFLRKYRLLINQREIRDVSLFLNLVNSK